MQIIVSNTSTKPIYEQVYSQIKAQILSKELKEGDMLPSMRVLAKELRISVITTKRAYEELERDGFIVSQTGKGSFVGKPNLQMLKEEYLKQIEGKLVDICELSKLCDINLNNLQDMLNVIYEGE